MFTNAILLFLSYSIPSHSLSSVYFRSYCPKYGPLRIKFCSILFPPFKIHCKILWLCTIGPPFWHSLILFDCPPCPKCYAHTVFGTHFSKMATLKLKIYLIINKYTVNVVIFALYIFLRISQILKSAKICTEQIYPI